MDKVYVPFDRVMVSEHLWLSEVRCHCGAPVCARSMQLPDPSVVGLFESLRWALGVPLLVSCCGRCVKHNAAVGGHPNSLHLLLAALDVCIPRGKSEYVVFNFADKIVGDGGLGRYPGRGFIHIDAGHLLGLPSRRRWEK